MKLKTLLKKGICVACAAGVLAAGTSVFAEGEAAAETTEATAEEQTEAEEVKTIGQKPEAADKEEISYEVELTNLTQKDITGVSIKEIDDAEYPDNMLKEEDVFKKDETRVLYYTPAKEESTAEDSAQEDEKLLEKGYDIQLTLVDDSGNESKMVLHAFPFEEAKKAELHLEDEVAFITYEVEKTEENAEKESISTKEAELAIKQTEAASAEQTSEEPAYVEPTYEEPVYEEPVYEAPVYEAPVYEAPVYEEPVYEAPVYEAPIADAGGAGDDGCVGDGLTY